MSTATPAPPTPASTGSAKRRRSRSSPRSNSRRASSPTTKKKNVIRPRFTQSRASREMPQRPMSIEMLVVQSEAYEPESTFAHTSAAAVAPSRTAAPPVSVCRKSRSGVCRLRAHAVRPVYAEVVPDASVNVLPALAQPPSARPDAEGNLVDVAPAPVLAGLRRADDRMAALVGVRGRVLVRRGVAAADLRARHAHAQMHPAAADLQALLATLDLVREGRELDLVEVAAGRSHGISFQSFAVRSATAKSDAGSVHQASSRSPARAASASNASRLNFALISTRS